MISRISGIPDDYAGRVVDRPDGFYWIDPDSKVEFGPFSTAAQAIADMEAGADSDYEPGESLQEAEDELGIADWIDPETGDLAEGSPPRLED